MLATLKLKAGRLANWPQTIINPIESFIQRGVIMVGAYIAMQDTTGIAVGGLVAFMMLGSPRHAAAGRPGAADRGLRGRARLDRPGRHGAEQPERDRGHAGRPPPEVPRRRDIRGADLYLSRLEAAGARQDQLRYPRRHDAGRGRTQRIGQKHDHPAVTGHQPRIQRLSQDRRRRTAGDQPHPSAPQLRRRAAGQLPVPRHGAGQHHRRASGADA